jgi:hypothetical protein
MAVDDSIEKTAREAIRAWVESLGLAPAPTVIQVEEPKPDSKRTLPTFGVTFGAEEWDSQVAEQVGAVGDRAILDFGGLSMQAGLVWRCASEDDAEAFRSQFRSKFLLTTQEETAGKLAGTFVVKLPATFFDTIAGTVTLYLQKGNNLIFPERRETGLVDYWVLTHSALVTLPLLVLEPLPGTGFMDVLINAGQADVDPFDMNNYGGP